MTWEEIREDTKLECQGICGVQAILYSKSHLNGKAVGIGQRELAHIQHWNILGWCNIGWFKLVDLGLWRRVLLLCILRTLLFNSFIIWKRKAYRSVLILLGQWMTPMHLAVMCIQAASYSQSLKDVEVVESG
jgi:hypothetical protein